MKLFNAVIPATFFFVLSHDLAVLRASRVTPPPHTHCEVALSCLNVFPQEKTALLEMIAQATVDVFKQQAERKLNAVNGTTQQQQSAW